MRLPTTAKFLIRLLFGALTGLALLAGQPAQAGRGVPLVLPDLVRAPRPAAGPIVHVIRALNGYAYLAAGPQVQTWDIHSLNHPRLVAQTVLSDTNIVDLAVAGNTLVALTQSLYVFSLAAPARPVLQSSLALDNIGTYGQVLLRGAYAYLSRSSNDPRIVGGVSVDLTDPVHPHEVGTFGSQPILLMAQGNDQLYLLESRKFEVASLANPVAPVVVGSAAAPWENYVSGIAVLGKYVYVTDGFPVVVADVTTPTAPIVARSPGSRAGSSAVVVGKRLYLRADVGSPVAGRETADVDTYDLTNPAAPQYEGGNLIVGPPEDLSATDDVLFATTHTPEWLVLGLTGDGLAMDLGPTFDSGALPATQPTIGQYQLFLPVVRQSVDLSTARLEVTQATQRVDNSVPLVAGKRTVVRVYAQVGGAGAVDGVAMTLSGTRDGVALPGSPLLLTSWAVFQSPDPGRYGQSFNFQLPDSWASSAITLWAMVNPTQTVAESNTGNNSAEVTVSFTPMPPLAVKIVPINYHDTANGKTYPGLIQDNISDVIRRLYAVSAVSASLRAPLDFTGDLAAEDVGWGDLLWQMAQLKSADGAPAAQVYYGTLREGDWASLWGGMGYMGSRTSAGVDYGPVLGGDPSGWVAAHEIGHNFGVRHAPCGSPLGPDPNYPYPNARIGQWGLDASRARVYSPSVYADVMSYCTPAWISDYNYIKLYHDQLAHGAVTATNTGAASLLVRAWLSAAGPATLLPIYQLDSPPDTLAETGPDRLELVGPDGAVLASYGVSPMVPADEAGSVSPTAPQLFSVRVPLPNVPLAAVRLRRGSVLIAERLLTTPAAIIPPAAVTVRRGPVQTTIAWDAGERPALVRYSTDKGLNWTTIALDAAGGSLSLAATQLPAKWDQLEISQGDLLTTPLVMAP